MQEIVSSFNIMVYVIFEMSNSSENVLAHSGFLMRCFPMAESLFILEFEFLHIRGGCFLIIVFFVLMLVGTCCFISVAIRRFVL